MHNKQTFDPMVLLNLNNTPKLSDDLTVKIGQYLLIRFAERLKSKDILVAETAEQIIKQAQKSLPDFNQQIQRFLQDFKREFNTNL